MYPGRGVLHTPHQTFSQENGIYKRRPNVRLFVPYGAIQWGVFEYPRPCNLETRRIFMYPGRGVLHTPHKTSLQGDEICKRRPNVRLFVPYGAIQ